MASNDREQLKAKILKDWLIHAASCEYSKFDDDCTCTQSSVAENIMPIIDTYTAQQVTKAEREARIDELEQLPRAGFIDSNGLRFGVITHTQIDNRIAELKQGEGDE